MTTTEQKLEAAREMLAALEEHVAAHDKIARDAQFTRCGCFSCDRFRDVIAAAGTAGIKVFDESERCNRCGYMRWHGDDCPHCDAPKVFKTTVLGVGPWCVEFADGEIVTCRTEERANAIAAARAAGIKVGEMGSQTTLDNRSDTQIEVVARAFCRRENPHYTPVQIDHAWGAYKEHAQDAIAAIHGSPS